MGWDGVCYPCEPQTPTDTSLFWGERVLLLRTAVEPLFLSAVNLVLFCYNANLP